MATTVEIVIEARDRTAGALRGIASNVQRIGRIATGVAVAGIGGLVSGLGAGAAIGLNFNNSMEQVSAQLNAFLKDGEAVESTLAMIRERAASTPFAFEDMARATAGLIPAANQSGAAIEDLIAQAEILAASNPAEGLEGAAFSLREALSGDFTSIIERFNLPRQRLNELKEQGVPALEAVSIAMQELGLDAELVTNLSQTATGRLSTIKDRLVGVAAELTAPIFERVSNGMGSFLDLLDSKGPQIDAFVASATASIDAFMTAFGDMFLNMIDDPSIGMFIESLGLFGVPQDVQDSLFAFSEAFQDMIARVQEFAAPLIEWVENNVQLRDVLTALGIAIAAFVVPALLSVLASILAIAAPIVALIALVALIRTAWENNWGGIQEKTAAAVEFVRNVIDTVMTAVRKFWEQNGDAILQKATEIWQNIQDAVDAAVTFVRDVIDSVMTTVRDFWAEHGDAILQKAEEIWQGIQDAVELAITHVQTIFDAFKLAFQGDWEGFGDKLREAWDMTWELIGDAIDTAIQVIRDINWGEIGANIIEGIANGIRAGASAIADAARSAASAALDAAKGFLGIRSPSTVFAKSVGVPIMQGIEAGIKQGQSSLDRTMSQAASRTVNQTVNIFANSLHAGNEIDMRARFAMGGI